MASSSIPGDGNDEPPPPMMTLPGICSKPAVKKLALKHGWTIGEPIPRRSDRHAAVYSILVTETGQLAEDLEAHVFILDGIEPKLRKHRHRCIRRMEARTKLKLEVDGITIVVITTSQRVGPAVLEESIERPSLNNDGQHETDSGTTSKVKVKHKTPHQLESQRIRQKERRQAKRSAKRRQCEEMIADDGRQIPETNDGAILTDEEDDISIFDLQLVLDDVRYAAAAVPLEYANPSKNVARRCLYEALDGHLEQSALTLQTTEEMESYLDARRDEISFLRSHRASTMSAEEYQFDKLVNLKREGAQHMEASLADRLNEHERGQEEARVKHDLELLKLEILIICRLLVSRVFVVSVVQRKISIKSFWYLGRAKQEEDLEFQVSRYKDWISTVSRSCKCTKTDGIAKDESGVMEGKIPQCRLWEYVRGVPTPSRAIWP